MKHDFWILGYGFKDALALGSDERDAFVKLGLQNCSDLAKAFTPGAQLCRNRDARREAAASDDHRAQRRAGRRLEDVPDSTTDDATWDPQKPLHLYAVEDANFRPVGTFGLYNVEQLADGSLSAMAMPGIPAPLFLQHGLDFLTTFLIEPLSEPRPHVGEWRFPIDYEGHRWGQWVFQRLPQGVVLERARGFPHRLRPR